MIDELGNRMKSKYEDSFRFVLPQRTFVVVRVDGKAFHTFTRKMPKPYYQPLHDAMDAAATTLCKEMMGCRMAYGQSDEFSFVLTDFEKHESEMWFSGNLQKIVSVSSSIFTAAFNKAFGGDKTAMFDARAFIIPSRDEVFNYFIWRQQDASRNSLNMLASCHYSHKELHGMGGPEKHELLYAKGVNWNDCETAFKRGRVIRKMPRERDVTFTHKGTKEQETKTITEHMWAVDPEIPVFTRDTGYLDNLIPIND